MSTLIYNALASYMVMCKTQTGPPNYFKIAIKFT